MSKGLLSVTARLILVAVLSGGCMRNVNENVIRVECDRLLAKYAWVDRVAVIPFSGGREGRYAIFGIKQKWPKNAGMIVSGLFANQLSKLERYQVRSPSDVQAELEKIYPEAVSGFISAREVKDIGSALRVDAVVVGEVDEYYTYQHHALKQSRVSARMMMIDAHTGKTMWEGRFTLDDTAKLYDLAKKGCEQIVIQLRGRVSERVE